MSTHLSAQVNTKLAKADRLAEIQSLLGKALWQTQALEDTLAHLIAMVLKISPKNSLKEAETILEGVRSKTLGQLVGNAKQAIKFDELFESFIASFVNERNWLVHRSWRTHRAFLEDEQEFINLRYRISRLISDGQELNSLFAEAIASYVQKTGMSNTDIELVMKEFQNL